MRQRLLSKAEYEARTKARSSVDTGKGKMNSYCNAHLLGYRGLPYRFYVFSVSPVYQGRAASRAPNIASGNGYADALATAGGYLHEADVDHQC